ncbi:MAG: autotransporter-associated beta strand repeat-containing protein [Deltaproteobacteria bacterium]|jgi:T5SS/PEP-CTERM-associated repeat protein/autotransporter-associated beta strand protein|nr:autotransporter-associated beta strand repeat-containing protein [Deltaproteobacteria bacterium]
MIRMTSHLCCFRKNAGRFSHLLAFTLILALILPVPALSARPALAATAIIPDSKDNVIGAGEALDVEGNLVVGEYGEGALSVTGGGMARAGSDFVIGNYAGSSGTVTVSGAGSSLEAVGNIIVGREGDGILNVENGGAVTGTGVLVGTNGQGMLAGTGTVNTSGNIFVGHNVIPAMGILAAGDAGNPTGTLTLNTNNYLFLDEGTVLRVNADADGNTSLIQVSNRVTVSTSNISSGHTIDLTSLRSINDKAILTAAGGISGDTPTWRFTLNGVPLSDILAMRNNLNTPNTRFSGDPDLSITHNGNSLNLTADLKAQNKSLYWKGGQGWAWNMTEQNWRNPSDTEADFFLIGDAVHFSGDTADAPITGNGTASFMDVTNGRWVFSGNIVVNDRLWVNSTYPTLPGGHTHSLELIGNADVTLSGNNSFRNGIEITASNSTLRLMNKNAAGTERIDNAGTLVLDFDGAFANTIAGTGSLTKEGTGTVDLTGDVEAGALNIAGGTVALTGTLVADTLNIATNGTMEISRSAAYALNPALSGDGIMAFDLGGNALTFDKSGNSFTGTLALENTSLAISGNAAGTLANSTLRLGSGATALVDTPQSIGGLDFDGGTLDLSDIVNPGAIDPVTALSVDTLDVAGGGGTVRVDLTSLDGIDTTVTGQGNFYDYAGASSSLYQKQLVDAGSVSGSGSLLVLDTSDGTDLTTGKQQIRDITDGANTVGKATFDYIAGVGADGVYLGYGLSELEALDGQSVTLDSTGSSGGATGTPSINAKLTGAGGFTFTGAQNATVGKADSDYTGMTTVDGINLTMLSNNAFGATSNLVLDNNAKIDMNGNSQTVGGLTGGSGTEIALGELTVAIAAPNITGYFNGVLSGSGSLTKDGAGSLTLTGTNTYTGLTEVRAGTLALSGAGTLGDNGSGGLSLYDSAIFDFSASSANSLTIPRLSVYGMGSQIEATGKSADFRGGDLFFDIPDTALAESILLAVNGNADMTGASISLDSTTGRHSLAAGDRVVLLDVSGLLTHDFVTAEITTSGGDTYTVQVSGNQLEAILGKISPFSPAYERLKAYAESRAVGLAFANQGMDLLLGQGVGSALSATSGAGYRTGGFGGLSGGWSRYNSGSHVDVSGSSFLAGLAIGNDIAGKNFGGRLTAGAFFEAGWGNYDSHNSFSNYASADGDGNTSYYGAGLLGRYDIKEGALSGLYVDGSARAGRAEADFSSDDIQYNGWSAGFESDSLYYGLHGGLGYVWDLSDKATLDASAKLLWTRQEGDSLTVYQDKLRFKDADSLRSRLGGRFTYDVSETISPYAGAYWEHEFDGKAGSTVNGQNIDAPSLKGDTGMAEFGLSFRPFAASAGEAGTAQNSDLPLSFELGLQAYTGKREGVSGSLQVKLEF